MKARKKRTKKRPRQSPHPLAPNGYFKFLFGRPGLLLLIFVLFLSGSHFVVRFEDRLTPALVSHGFQFLGYKKATTTVFWVGEGASRANGRIHNFSSAWDDTWAKSYGGVDTPYVRCGLFPCTFIPKQNPFYFALPYDDLVAFTGIRKDGSRKIPWYDKESAKNFDSILEDHWIKILHNEHACFAQWKDVGPFKTNDFAYVFGNASQPENTKGLGAGLDVSPATRDCLRFMGSTQTHWKFIDEDDVPPGPWKVIVNGRG